MRDFLVLRLRIFKTLQLFVPTASGSGVTLNECTFSPKKAHITQGFFQERSLQGFSSKEPRSSLFHLAKPEETRRHKFNHETLGGLVHTRSAGFLIGTTTSSGP
jgi:hypothetical protein